MSRSKTSKRWLREHFDDPYVKKAQQEGYRSRAAYKLLELQEKDRLAVIEERERSFVANYIEPYLTKHLDLLQLNSDDLKAESDQYRIFIEMTYGQEFGSLLFYKTKRTSSALSYSQRVLDLIKSLQVLLNEAKN